MKQDHLARAKDYIAKGEGYYRKAAEEIVAAMEADPTLSQREIGRRLGRDQKWVARLVRWSTSADRDTSTPFHSPTLERARNKSEAKKALRDPDIRRRVIAELPPAELEAVREEASEVAIERSRAAYAEHQTKPTARELTGGEEFKPDEFWADKFILRVNTNARELASRIKRGGGLILGAMEPERAHEYLDEAERLIAEARAAAQEQARDRAEVV